jgi:hypothetical protein
MDYIELREHIANTLKNKDNTPNKLDVYGLAIQPTLIKYQLDYIQRNNNTIWIQNGDPMHPPLKYKICWYEYNNMYLKYISDHFVKTLNVYKQNYNN